MSRRLLPILALILTVAATTSLVQSALVTPPSFAASADAWEYAELADTETHIWLQTRGKRIEIATDITRLGDDMWSELAKKSEFDVEGDPSHVGFLNALGKRGWEICGFSVRSWATPPAEGKYWTLRRKR